jgi:hypothetical protein
LNAGAARVRRVESDPLKAHRAVLWLNADGARHPSVDSVVETALQ